MNVYLVTEGEYSSYELRAVFDSEAVAQQFAKEVGGQVETYPLLTEKPQRRRVYCIRKVPGKKEPDRWNHVQYDFDYGIEAYSRNGRPTVRENVRPAGGARPGLYLTISGTDESAVEKAYQDRMMRWKAEQEGVA